MTAALKTRLVRGKVAVRLKGGGHKLGEQARKDEAKEDWEKWRDEMLSYLKEKDEPTPVSAVYTFFGWPPTRPGTLVSKFPTTFVTWKEEARRGGSKHHITMVDIHHHQASQQPSVMAWLKETQAARIP